MNLAAWACIGCVVILLVAEARQAAGLRVLAKCGAAVAMVLGALLGGAAGSPAGARILAGLGLSAGGDISLLSSRRAGFVVGLLLFAAAHVAYVLAAWQLRASWLGAVGLGAALTGFMARPAWRWLSPHVPTALRLAVLGYIALITAMVAFAGSASLFGDAPAHLGLGAILFYASDLAVARERFVVGSVLNRLWGLPAYFGGQLLIALAVCPPP